MDPRTLSSGTIAGLQGQMTGSLGTIAGSLAGTNAFCVGIMIQFLFHGPLDSAFILFTNWPLESQISAVFLPTISLHLFYC